MSQLLDELVYLVGTLSPENAAEAKARLLERVNQLAPELKLALRREATAARAAFALGSPAWQVRQLIAQCLWHVTYVKAAESAEQQAWREQMERDAGRNGDWYSGGTWLSADEVGERIKQRTAELSQESPSDAS
jgi:hypothetical protein